MVLNLSREERDSLRCDLSAAEPFDDNDLIWDTFDDSDWYMFRTGQIPDLEKQAERSARWAATSAKQLLEQDEREKAALGYPLEPESTPQSERRKRLEESERQKTEEDGTVKPSTPGKGK